MHLFPELDELTDREIHSRIAPRGTKPQPIQFRPGTVIVDYLGNSYTVRGGGSDDRGEAVIDCADKNNQAYRFRAKALGEHIRAGSMWIDKTPPKTKQPTAAERREIIRKQHPGVVLLFRMGDFYELFDDDARLASKTLGLTLTTRKAAGIETPMAGFPYHHLDCYLAKLVKSGHRVAVCESTEAK